MVLVNGFDAWVDTPSGSYALSSQQYEPGITHPDGATRITAFATEPWPRWTFLLPGGMTIEQSLVVRHGQPTVAISWELTSGGATRNPVVLHVRPFLSGRDYHSIHRANGAFRFEPQQEGQTYIWQPYDGVPAVHILTSGTYSHAPEWFRNFRYDEEYARGLDGTEDLAAPGIFRFVLDEGLAEFVLATAIADQRPFAPGTNARAYAEGVRAHEAARRSAFPSRLHRAADGYLVGRGSGTTIVAGYPWFTDWGRDTFIALRGICLAADRVDDARRILVEWSGAISEGMLPNHFPDHGEAPEFNSVDASLWFVIAVYDLFAASARCGAAVSAPDRAALETAVDAILSGYAAGTRYGIRLDADGLLSSGTAGVALTWMDAKVGDWVVTPRVGKPVEVEALWLNALWMAGQHGPRWLEIFERGRQSFRARFWNEDTGALNDVVDVNHEPGTADPSFRPNQIFALGGLPVALIDDALARRAVDAVERRLWTPMGLRSLAPGERGYIGFYGGSVRARDAAYHQGTVWPWLLTPFVEAWLRTRGDTAAARQAARERFLAPLVRHLDEAGLNHVSEIADGDAPHRPNGCPFQAWSVGELLRLDRVVLKTVLEPGAQA
jgi:predicted glycogen debranching enzyme